MCRQTVPLVCVLSIWAGSASAEPEPVAGELPRILVDVMDFLGFDASRRQALLEGEILHTGVPELETLPEAVAVAGVMLLVRQPVERVIEAYLAEETFRAHADIVDYGRIPESPKGTGSIWTPGPRYRQGEESEARRLLRARPGKELNLAAAEAERFRALGPETTLERISATYAEILTQRHEAYLRGGLDGIEPYARKGGKTASPARELAAALESTWLLERHAPDFRSALAEFPRTRSADLLHRHYWVKKRISGRPLFALTHQIVSVRPELAIGAEREIYAGHSYNSLLTLIGVAPYREDSVVFAAVRLFTEKVTGLGSDLRRSLGRAAVGRKLALHFGNLRELLEEATDH